MESIWIRCKRLNLIGLSTISPLLHEISGLVTSALAPLFSLITHPGFQEEYEHRLVRKFEEENATQITYPFNLEDIKEVGLAQVAIQMQKIILN